MRRSIAALAFTVVLASAARAQGGWLMQGTLDLEGWKTDTTSSMLARNGGDPAGLCRLRAWTAVEPWRALFLFANAEVEGGSARAYDGQGASVDLEQWGARYARHPSLVVEAGKMIHPVGAFGGRIISTRNPLIGVPDGYSPVYPVGVKVGGERGKVDYRVAAVTLPLTHRNYVPDPDPAVRPVAGIGITPIVGLRLGASATAGPYLNGDLSAADLDGKSWRAYHQQILGAEGQYGFGHFDLRGEFAWARFDVPRNGWISGKTGYAEARATLTPRTFVAARAELNHYPFIRPTASGAWISRETRFRDYEVGGGFRVNASTTLKASLRWDDWDVTPQNYAFVRPGGKAFAIQLSRAFDVADWLASAR